ncbi:hypothetical protein F5Y13DRAFT_170924 [Hypoxylon sp. FL1857]|nr:hypothetical protein F5Y13DRAFT_170924 [Hypoxylon sp. FL1857]
MAARKPSVICWVAALLLSVISLVLILLIILSGIGGRVLADYMTIDTKDLDIPPKLGTSVFLTDLKSVAGLDFVGSDTTAKSLGLSSTYSLNLLTACSEDDGSTTCETPKVGFKFDPSSDLRLDGTSIEGTFSSAYSDELQTYSKVSTFVGVGYIIGAVFTGLSCLFIIASRCFPKIILGGQISSGLAFLFLLASAIASVVTFVKLENTFNDALGSSGVHAHTSSTMFGLGFGAAAATFIAFLLMFPLSKSSRRQQQPRHIVTDAKEAPVPKPGLLSRVKTWNQHKYMQVEKQKPMIHHRSPSRGSDREGLIAAVEDDFSHEYPNDFAMGPMEKKQNSSKLNGPSRDPSAAYDPHVNTAYEPQVATTRDPRWI